MSGRDVVLAGDNATTLALARHGATVLLRVAHETVAAVGLGDVLVALRSGFGATGSGHAGASTVQSSTVQSSIFHSSIFHDEELDGPLPRRVRTFVLTTEAERPTVTARVSGYDDLDVVNAEDVPDRPEPGGAAAGGRGMEQQLAKLAVRLEMTAVYLRLVRG